MNKSKKILSLFICIITILSTIIISGCKNNSIAGTWAYVDSDGVVSTNSFMYFNDDGTCSDIDYSGATSADPVSYVIQTNGTLTFTMEWDGKTSFNLAKSEEEALKDYHSYYLSGDTLIFRTNKYKRV